MTTIQMPTLLIVDDEPLNLAELRQILSDDYHLVFAKNGVDALAVANKHKPSLILLDIEMPGMDGYSVCQTLKEDSSLGDVPVIFVTSMTDVGNEEAGFASGAVDYIVKPVSPAIVKARIRLHLSLVRATQLEQSYRNALYMLSEAGHYNDSDTGVHIWRMSAYAGALADAAGWAEDDVRALELAAPMHDTGKIGIPDTILRKPGALDAAEWEIMKSHTVIGYEILSKSAAPVFQLAAQVALRHHEKWDGGGYPDGIAGEAIPESARIVAVADVFDALTMQRPYKPAWPVEKALDTMRTNSGSHFEPRLIELFESILPKILHLKERWDAQESET